MALLRDEISLIEQSAMPKLETCQATVDDGEAPNMNLSLGPRSGSHS
jgi:hypothetical protein